MSEQIAETRKGGRDSRAVWIIALAFALVFIWLVCTATQTSTNGSNTSSMPGMSDMAPTSMPQSMPGTNHQSKAS